MLPPSNNPTKHVINKKQKKGHGFFYGNHDPFKYSKNQSRHQEEPVLYVDFNWSMRQKPDKKRYSWPTFLQ
jgi:hypothetical protein